MHAVDLIVVWTAVLLVILGAAILGRQRHMLRATGAVPLALRRGGRWVYGTGRYDGGELRVYRVLGIGTRPSRVLRRGHFEVSGRRGPLPAERHALPATAVVVECQVDDETFEFAIGENAFTGFVSWMESGAPR